jgi:hypothetical protein
MLEGLLYLLPLIALAAPLLRGRFLGERAIAGLRSRLGRSRRLRAARRLGGAARAPRALPRGGALIATALASRPPPAAPALN